MTALSTNKMGKRTQEGRKGREALGADLQMFAGSAVCLHLQGAGPALRSIATVHVVTVAVSSWAIVTKRVSLVTLLC
jgi:hypothetical protein